MRGKKRRSPPPPREPAEPRHRPFAEAAERLKRALPLPAPHAPPAPPIAPADPSEDELLEASRAGARPLSDRSRISPPRKARPSTPHYDEEAEALAKLAALLEGEEPLDYRFSDEHSEWLAEGVDPGILFRLTAGEFSPQAHLDLHGMTREQAKGAVVRFLAQARVRRYRCVLVVTGRGKRSSDGVPVLKLAVQRWLVRGGLGKWVLAYSTAQPVDGGAGAIYVLLRD